MIPIMCGLDSRGSVYPTVMDTDCCFRLWTLCWRWWEIADDPHVPLDRRMAFEDCADELSHQIGAVPGVRRVLV
jgi:hypothetical protein